MRQLELSSVITAGELGGIALRTWETLHGGTQRIFESLSRRIGIVISVGHRSHQYPGKWRYAD